MTFGTDKKILTLKRRYPVPKTVALIKYILKISPPKTESFQIKNLIFFSYFLLKT